MVTILSLCHSPVAIREIQKQTEAKIEDQISHYPPSTPPLPLLLEENRGQNRGSHRSLRGAKHVATRWPPLVGFI